VLVVEIRLLGPVEVWAGDRAMPAGPPQQNAILAALAVDADRPVTVERVIDRVWADDPPARARSAVAARITHIRQLLATAAAAEPAGEHAGPAVRWHAGGYRLRVDPDRVDLLRFRRLVAAARPARGADRCRLLADALALWRGTPLAGVRGGWADRMRDSWRLERLAAAVEWGRATLALGQPAAVVPAALELTEEHPHSEALAAVLVRALAAAGRRDEAVAQVGAACRRVRADLGAEPGPDLRALRLALLRDQPLPAGPGDDPPVPPAPPSPAAAAAVVVPAQLPGDVPGFAGRGAELARLDGLLLAADAGGPRLAAVTGGAGMGKSALAVHWAHRVRDRFPDGQLYLNLRGFDPGGKVLAPAEAVPAVLEALGVAAQRIPLSLDAQTGLYRSLLAGKRVLVVLDNARDADQVRPLLPGTPTAVTVVTSRSRLTPLVAAAGADPVPLDVLSTVEARELLAHRLGPARVAAEPGAVREIIAACARLPLALTVAAARARQSDQPLTGLAAELAGAGDRLDSLDGGDAVTEVRAVFSWSYRALSPPAAALFRLVGLHPGPDLSVAAAASLAGLPAPPTRRLLRELTHASLVGEHRPGRYACHDLLRAYAAELGAQTDPAADRRAATIRVIDHYLHSAEAVGELLYPQRPPPCVPVAAPAGGVAPETFDAEAAGTEWLSVEYPVLLAVLRLAAGGGYDTRAWQLASVLFVLLVWHAHWQDHSEIGAVALAAAERLGNPAAQAEAHDDLGYTYTFLDRYADAHRHLDIGLDLFERAADPRGQGRVHHHLSILHRRQGRVDEAFAHAERALALFRADGYRRGQAVLLNQLGWECVLRGEYERAEDYCTQALVLFREIGDRGGEGVTLDSLGYALHHRGRYAEAIRAYQESLVRARQLCARYEESATLDHLGDTHAAAGEPATARACWRRALAVLVGLDHPDAVAVRAKLDPPAGRADRAG
jgi:DNA-binding SARP family transcriptional activator/tetratricopeptide (TPR) repeat protein